MIATYPLRNSLPETSDKPTVLQQIWSKAKHTAIIGTESGQHQQTTTSPPESEDGDYHLGRLIYML